ncbi:carboxylating nicotinate-nucleotide diphosphorylase [Tuberibacillus sp. Marseille-P3662]|uniref:carboxylating nicotinate-nucleotide diphosphorylase n=1 Tax=Tuberibacillus sp. Marseille-P3662 TaxID=1965358 RepID=UPI000A1CEA6E|nr:carboxylating nicotinate-nucleotide diphosphorylase [Tuberibacillus sp. Marseille-P3662]
MNKGAIQEHLKTFFNEDIGRGDLSTGSLFNHKKLAVGTLVAKTDGVIAGIDVFLEGLKWKNDHARFYLHADDGDKVKQGDVIMQVESPVTLLLERERVLLNLIQRMSGIATATKRATEALKSSQTRICDTRKTAPGLRMFDKWAVRCGGGFNHRYGLYDGVMLKDNHIKQAGSIRKAVETVRRNIGHMTKIEVETERCEQVLEAVEAGADVIMFDNRSPEEIESFVKLVPKHIMTEASGGISEQALSQYAKTGVDVISLGYLTHSVKALDISFNLL